MKKIKTILIIILFCVGNVFAQQEKGIIGKNNWLNNWTEFNPNKAYYGEPTEILTGNISKDTKLIKRNVYLLLGSVFVTKGVTLTIEPGTVILADYTSKASLTIAKGATLMAEGLETDPIVFTSNRVVKRAGDWGGIILLGNAPTNRFGNGSVAKYHTKLSSSSYSSTNFGGVNVKSNSGVMKYVRIEYSGKRLKEVGYFSGLLLAGVGKGTVIENIMVSYCAGNSFLVWGGNVNLEKLISFKTNGNDFKFNYGAQSVLNNSLAVRTPYVSSSDGARCLEVKSFNEKGEIDFSKKGTNVVAKNLTMVNNSEDLSGDIEKGLVKEAVYISEHTSLNISKSVISGFNPAVIFQETISVNQENLEKIKLTDIFFNNCKGNIFVEYRSNNADLENWYGNNAFFNVYSKSSNVETFIDLNHGKRPDFRLRINKIKASQYQYTLDNN